uniref:DDB1- and CUL4-associated factor 10 homolog n=1 Tax=Cacopsylla melanoneura TaxID=428564 RepID=A0A8D8Y994_9HEMI
MTDPNIPGPSRPRHPSTRRFLSPSEPTVMESLEKTYSVKRSLNMFSDSWLYDRELGMRRKLGTENQVQKSLYSALKPIAKWGDMEQTGGIFNLEFSQDGSLLVAACEKKCVYMFDPLSKAVIGSIPEAHTDCVNYVRFLDTRVFATCSDDTTIALWDARNLKTRVRTLQGHSNWVKNIEFSWKDNLLVTAGFDGSIYTWDINNYTETGFVYDRVFQTNGLMRMRLNPDASKMVICTTAGYLILIHDLNLATLAQDLLGFRPNMYRLMQLSDTALPMAFEYHHLFSKGRTRNRVEFITDFPFGDEAEVISSLQIHPHGWCALSRNISNSERSEWTCVHDIQEYPEYTNEDNSSEEEDNASECLDSDPLSAGPVSGVSRSTDTREPTSGVATTSSSSQRPVRRARRRQHPYNERTLLSNTTENRYPQLEISTADIWEALLVLREARSIQGGSGAAARSVLHQQEYDQDLVRIIRMSSGLPNQSQGGDESAPTLGDSDNDETESGDTTSDPDHEIDESANRSERRRQQRENERRRRRGSRRPEGGGGGEETTTEGSGGTVGESESNRVVFRFTNSRSEEQVFVVTDRSGNAATPGGANSNQRRTNPSGDRSGGPKDEKANKKSAAAKKWFVQNKPRLTHYVEELNVGKGYIKELCFSSDGRLVCSPFSFGVRLFSFNEECAHMSSCMSHDGSQQVPAQLFELTSSSNHSDIVLSCKFSPTHNILASGCLNGRIVLYQPVF